MGPLQDVRILDLSRLEWEAGCPVNTTPVLRSFFLIVVVMLHLKE